MQYGSQKDYKTCAGKLTGTILYSRSQSAYVISICILFVSASTTRHDAVNAAGQDHFSGARSKSMH